MQVWIGTCGYAFPDWVGGFYPAGTPPGRMLAYYVAHFPLVELNFTFYGPPTPEHLARLVKQTPPGFQFTVKLHQSMSHDHDLAGASPFAEAVDVLRLENRLMALLCQYPQRFHYDARNLDRLAALAECFEGYPVAVEFRHQTWARPEVPDWLRTRGLHLVSVDSPPIESLYPTGLVQSSRLIYVRLHSRRAASWYESDKDRYDYSYSDDELNEWLQALQERQADVDRALVLFNNCRDSQAAVNAGRLMTLIQTTRPDWTLVPPFAAQDSSRQGLLF